MYFPSYQIPCFTYLGELSSLPSLPPVPSPMFISILVLCKVNTAFFKPLLPCFPTHLFLLSHTTHALFFYPSTSSAHPLDWLPSLLSNVNNLPLHLIILSLFALTVHLLSLQQLQSHLSTQAFCPEFA